MKKILSASLAAAIMLSSIPTFAMSTYDFNNGMRKGLEYYNKQLYYEARDEFQWFCDYNWGAMTYSQQQTALYYLDSSKAEIQKLNNPALAYQKWVGDFIYTDDSYYGAAAITLSDINSKALTIDYFSVKHSGYNYTFNRAYRQSNGSYYATGNAHQRVLGTDEAINITLWLEDSGTVAVKFSHSNGYATFTKDY